MLALDHTLSSRPQQQSWRPTSQCAWCHTALASTAWRLPAAASAVSLEQDLLAWARRRGVNVEKLIARPSPDRQGDLLLRAGRSCPKGETVFSIPKEVWLTPDRVKQSPVGPALASLEPWLQIALFLLYVRRSRSPDWLPYVASLPEPQSPLSWSEEELDELAGTQLYTTLQGYRQFFKGLYAKLQANIFSQDPATFSEDVFSFDNMVWAIQIVRAHVHGPLEGKDVALVPIADLVHHQRGVRTQWKLQKNVLSRGQTLIMDAGTSLQSGQPISMDFGPDRPDASLLLDYGVLDHTQPAPGFVLTLALPEADKLYDDKADTLDINGLGESHAFTLHPGQQPSTEMLAFLRLMNLGGQDAFLMESLFRNEVWGHLEAPISEVNEAAVYASMIEGCRDALQAYPTSIDEDLALLRDLSPGTRQHKAVQVRLGEKESLDSALSFFESRQQRLDDLEYYQERRLKRLGLLDDTGGSTYDDFFKGGIA